MNVDMEYNPYDGNQHPACYFDELFAMAKLDCSDDIQVLVTKHDEAYVKQKKHSMNGTSITGWISLKEYSNGGGYLSDNYIKYLDKVPIKF